MKQQKILFAISAIESQVLDGLETFISPFNWNDFELIQDENGQYYISVETALGFAKEDGCVEYMHYLLNTLTDWMTKHNYDITKELDMYEVFTRGTNINSTFDSIEECYAMFKLLVRGFNGKSNL